MSNQPLDFIKFAAAKALAVPNLIQLRPHTVTLIAITWSGDRPGTGTKTTVQTTILNDGYVNPKFRQVSKEDIVLSGGLLRDQDIIIGPFVFPFDAGTNTGGLEPLTFSPANASEVYFNVEGPNFPAGGVKYKKIYDNSEKNVLYHIYLRAVAANP